MSLALLLTRDYREPNYCLGVMGVGSHKIHTMERGWVPSSNGGKSGKRFESCIAAGTYRLVPHRSEKYGNVWAMVNPALDVYHFPGDIPAAKRESARAACLIHAANFWHELLGCIGPGRDRIRQANGEWMVARSRDALNLIKTVIGSQLDVTLTIAWAEGLQPQEASNG